jgi:hypothetical protein
MNVAKQVIATMLSCLAALIVYSTPGSVGYGAATLCALLAMGIFMDATRTG